MPDKGKEIKIAHGFDINNVVGINVIVINGTKYNPIIRSQVINYYNLHLG